MSSERPADQLRNEQSRREAQERELAGSAVDEQESAQHRRRAEKAHYLREKLEERAESEREAAAEAEGADGPD